jgi:hypothetical protein
MFAEVTQKLGHGARDSYGAYKERQKAREYEEKKLRQNLKIKTLEGKLINS